MKEAEIKKRKYFQGQNYAIRLSENHKIKALSCPNFPGKTRLFFVLFWLFFAKKGVWSKVKGSRSKFDLPQCSLAILEHHLVKKVLFQHFPVLRL